MRIPSTPSTSGPGANFKLKIKKVAGYWNYDSSEFDRQSALLDDDDAMEAIWKKEYSLAELVAPDQFKSYDELKKRLDYVLGNAPSRSRVNEDLEDESEGRGSFTPDFKSSTPPAPSGGGFNDPDITPSNTSEDEDDALSYFAKLAEE